MLSINIRHHGRLLSAMVTALFAGVSAHAFDFQYGGIYYNFTADRRAVEVTYPQLNAANYAGKVEIPATVEYMLNKYPVRGIGMHAFFNCQDLDEVVIPEGVITIEQQAFSRCFYLTSVTLPSTLQRIADSAFEFCEDLPAISIPANVSAMGYGVFYDCRSIARYDVDPANKVYKTGEDGALYLANGTMLIQYPAASEATTYTFPSSVTRIPDYAFSPAPHLRRVDIGANLLGVPPTTFAECSSLEAVEVDPANSYVASVDGVLYSKAIDTLLQYPRSREGMDFVVPATVKRLEDMSFVGNMVLEQLTLGESVAEIGDYVFANCLYINSLTVEGKTPPAASVQTFDDAFLADVLLSVPREAEQRYRTTTPWRNFKQIMVTGTPSAIEAVDAEEEAPLGTTQVYDTMGRLVGSDEASHGVYIVVKGGRVERIAR